MHVDSANLASQGATGHTPTATSANHKSFWSEFIGRVAEAAGIDPHLALQVAWHESSLNPNAVNRSSGAVGIMQLMPATAADLGVDPHNAADNVRGGIRYLRAQLTRFGDAAQALAAYNWGPRHVAHAVARWGSEWLSHAPSETRHYVASILSHAGLGAPQTSGDSAVMAANQTNATPVLTANSLPPTSAAELAQLHAALAAYHLEQILR